MTTTEWDDPTPNHSLFYLLATAVSTANQDLLQNGQTGETVISQYGLTLALKWINFTNTGAVTGIIKLVLKAQIPGLPTISIPIWEVGLAAGGSFPITEENFKLIAPAGYSFQVIATASTFDVQALAYFSEG